MKVLIINGSPRKEGNTSHALKEMENIFHKEGIETETLNIGNLPIRSCIACNSCVKTHKCVFDDIVNEAAIKFEECDGIVVGSPVYYASANPTVMAFLTRLFYSTYFDKTMKIGVAVVVARRSGITSSLDEINKFFSIDGMPIASGQYWNGAHGRAKGEVLQDIEGMQIMRTLAKNMSFLLKSIQLGKEQLGLPEKEPKEFMNFIH